MLVGIAIDRGYIQNVDEPAFPYFPEYARLSNEQKDRITLKHLHRSRNGATEPGSRLSSCQPRTLHVFCGDVLAHLRQGDLLLPAG